MSNKLLSVTTLVLLMTGAAAHAEMWNCDYDGSWDTFDSSNQGSFQWHVIWQSSARGGWNLTGDYEDRYGESTLNGSCNDHSCLLKQAYSSGELEGKNYYWRGDYTDDLDGDTSVNNFTGTWGTTSAAENGGNWHAIANCTRNR